MKKSRIFILFIFIIIFSIFICPFSASAYTPSSFDVNANNALLISMDGNTVLFERNADEKVYPAAITKVMTAALIAERSDDIYNEKITVSSSVLNALKGISYNAYNLSAGEKIPAIDLVYLIMLASSNEATEIAAEYYGGGSIQNFVKMMNEKAAALGMEHTNFANTTGFQDEKQYTTVRDIYKLAKYAMSFEVLEKVSETRLYEMPPTNLYNKKRYILTSNWLRDSSTDYFYRYATGIKTGYTEEAGRCLVASATKDKKKYICILMNSAVTDQKGKDVHYEFTDAKNLLEWAFNDFTPKTVLTTNAPAGEAKVTYAWETDYVPLYPAEEISATIPSSADTSTIVTETHLNQEAFEAPIVQGDVLGYVTVSYAGVEIGKTDLIAGESVERSSLLSAWGQIIKTVQSFWFKVAVLAVILFIIIRTIISSIRRKRRIKLRRVRDYRRM